MVSDGECEPEQPSAAEKMVVKYDDRTGDAAGCRRLRVEVEEKEMVMEERR